MSAEIDQSFTINVLDVAPEFLAFSKEVWSIWLMRNISELGDPVSAGTLMDAFCWGMRLTLKQHAITQNYPQIVFIRDTDQVKTGIFYDPENNLIFIKRKFLAIMSELDQARVWGFHRDTGELFFEGYPADLFRLHGCEETDHFIYFPVAKDRSTNHDPLSVSLAEGDSTDLEFHSLLWRLEVAKNASMPEQSITSLQKRIDDASIIRVRRGQRIKF